MFISIFYGQVAVQWGNIETVFRKQPNFQEYGATSALFWSVIPVHKGSTIFCATNRLPMTWEYTISWWFGGVFNRRSPSVL